MNTWKRAGIALGFGGLMAAIGPLAEVAGPNTEEWRSHIAACAPYLGSVVIDTHVLPVGCQYFADSIKFSGSVDVEGNQTSAPSNIVYHLPVKDQFVKDQLTQVTEWEKTDQVLDYGFPAGGVVFAGVMYVLLARKEKERQATPNILGSWQRTF